MQVAAEGAALCEAPAAEAIGAAPWSSPKISLSKVFFSDFDSNLSATMFVVTVIFAPFLTGVWRTTTHLSPWSVVSRT